MRSLDLADQRCRLAPADADFLRSGLDSLPTSESQGHALTIDLNGHVVVRGRGEGQVQPTELVLGHSETHGEPRAYATHRANLSRALSFGLHQLSFFGDSTIQAQGGSSSYIWVPLVKELCVPSSQDAIRVEAPVASTPAAAVTPEPKRKKSVTKTKTQPTEAAAPPAAPATQPSTDTAEAKPRKKRREPQTVSCVSPIEQARLLRTSLRETLSKTNELIRSLKRQQKQSKAVASTLASLKQLQSLSA